MINKLIALSALAFASSVSALDAPAALVPAGLSPGNTFYIVFVGSDTLNGAQTSATYASYAATVKANDVDTDSITGWTTLFGHDDSTLVTTSAFTATNRPIYNTNGDRIALSMAGFFSNTLENPVAYDEQGNLVSVNVWTGFNPSGTSTGIGDDSLGGNDSLNDGCLAGNSSQATDLWAASALLGSAGCAGVSLGLYVLSPLLTVPGVVAASSQATEW